METIRNSQQRQLLPVPVTDRAYRQYPAELVDRIRFIKRAQALGFALDEIAGLLSLEDGSDRESIRGISSSRLAQIEAKVAALRRMQTALEHLIDACERADHRLACPIIDTLAHGAPAADP